MVSVKRTGWRCDAGELLGEVVAELFDVVGVGGVVDVDAAGADLRGLAVGEELLDGVVVTGDDSAGGAVVGGDGESAVPGGE